MLPNPDPSAWPLKPVIQNKLQNHITIELLQGRFQEDETIRVEAGPGELAFTKA